MIANVKIVRCCFIQIIAMKKTCIAVMTRMIPTREVHVYVLDIQVHGNSLKDGKERTKGTFNAKTASNEVVLFDIPRIHTHTQSR